MTSSTTTIIQQAWIGRSQPSKRLSGLPMKASEASHAHSAPGSHAPRQMQKAANTSKGQAKMIAGVNGASESTATHAASNTLHQASTRNVRVVMPISARPLTVVREHNACALP
ncbi:MAG: hypothetical protein NQ090_05380 [Stenotrophomonas sp.]|nr:hypothetical protein [Stenotrophomonas sp.]